MFRGRLAEDFKLATGTFVRVGAVRTALLSAVPVLSDVVVAGQDRDFVTALAWLNLAEAAKLLGSDAGFDGEWSCTRAWASCSRGRWPRTTRRRARRPASSGC